MNIVACLHTALLVRDLAQAERFYGEVLGLQKVDRGLKYPGAWYQVGPHQIHLIQDTTAPPALHNRDQWGRNPHVAFGVRDLAAVQAELTDQGYPCQRSASGRSALFTQDPDGNVIEISEIPGTL